MFTGSKKKKISNIANLPHMLATYQLINDPRRAKSQIQPILLLLHLICVQSQPYLNPFCAPFVPLAPAQKVAPWVKGPMIPSAIHNLIALHTPHHMTVCGGWVFSPSTPLSRCPTLHHMPFIRHSQEVILQGWKEKAESCGIALSETAEVLPWAEMGSRMGEWWHLCGKSKLYIQPVSFLWAPHTLNMNSFALPISPWDR